MKVVLTLAFLLCGCASPSLQAPTKSVAQIYAEAHERHFAAADKWIDVIAKYSSCVRVAVESGKDIQVCIDDLPSQETYIPKDRRKDETIDEYLARKEDEWDEQECFYKGLMQARYLGENQRIEDQCKRDLEIKRLRRAVEKLNKQSQQ